MRYRELLRLNEQIRNTKKCGCGEIVINELRPSQKHLIISSDPNLDNDRRRGGSGRDSSFAERVLSLIFYGTDDLASVEKVRANYDKCNEVFLNSFYWTHYCKCYAQGSPDSFWADRFLKKEIELFEPKLMIIFGSKPADFLLGKCKLKDRVNRFLEWNGIPLICTLHPSRDWNLHKREEYEFGQTWKLIRSKIKV
ncbi:MAG: hypothetical protein UX65_C0015G0004 [Parcubacteria group bacterium GW2011_GWB1_46_8]|nr:MAG: hypothetical protein UX14_C0038G0005 [Parcubacteria group bacterium GW2011_GWF1_45_5]KKU11300.1 MAG: hypothetical protein UX15_C0010G0004 [Parcubacteria group bacterium GW2011_GWA1_45_7]KKU43919.1 MAG: hypothetical protein UX61_C0008G0003 [Parcubacteria group bacterium GW2011_GWA2_46_7]KKU45914.1 MAG: hypothetical protein UX65_C0015G0004 [Parcubacteria group bacterium GW2011_GWB1_46_8]